MLGRNAAGIYWMFRYLERCENSARLLRAGLRISITQSDYGSQDWDSVLRQPQLNRYLIEIIVNAILLTLLTLS